MKSSLKIGIIGTRGIPNRYGGFEQCAEYLALGLTAHGHDVHVYNSHNHEYQQEEWKNIHIIHCYDPEFKVGTMGQFIYDWNCINDARKRDFDIVLQLGYTSSSVWYWRWPSKAKNIINMDGLEWKRSKYSKKVRHFLRHAERLAVKHGDVLISDSVGIQDHIRTYYHKDSVYIPYGAEIFETPEANILKDYALEPYNYNLVIARLEPENNIEMTIKGHLLAASDKKLLIVGKTDNLHGSYLVNNYGKHENIIFAGSIYNARIINNLRYFSLIYFHGHSVGGTNPSLIEAMACNALVAAHKNIFNEAILNGDALYFTKAEDIAALLEIAKNKDDYTNLLEHNRQKIQETYSWPKIVDAYEKVMRSAVK